MTPEQIEAFNNRFAALGVDANVIAAAAGISSNAAAWFRDEVLGNSDLSQAEANMLLLESAQMSYVASVLPDAEKTNAIFLRKAAIINGQEVIALMSYLNEERVITVQDSLALMANTDVQSAVGALQVGALESARSLIAALDLTGLVVTEADRAEILAKLDEFIGA